MGWKERQEGVSSGEVNSWVSSRLAVLHSRIDRSALAGDDVVGQAGGHGRDHQLWSTPDQIGQDRAVEHSVPFARGLQDGKSADHAGDVGAVGISGEEALGLIAVGSSDADRYNSNVGTLFLTHIADVISRLLPRLQAE